MVDIKLSGGRSGYDVVGEYVKRYWEHNIASTVVVSLGTSHDGVIYDLKKEIAIPWIFEDVEFLDDWWAGEKYIKLFGIKTLDELDISGGIYEKD